MSGLPALAVAKNGTIGFLYTDFVAGRLQTHLVQTNRDFITFQDDMFFSFRNGSPGSQGDPYIGDFQELIAVGDTFYGSFGASNNLNEVLTPFGGLDEFARVHVGDPALRTFALRNLNNQSVPFSIDPYFFSVPALGPVPEPATIWLLAIGGCGMTWWLRHRRT